MNLNVLPFTRSARVSARAISGSIARSHLLFSDRLVEYCGQRQAGLKILVADRGGNLHWEDEPAYKYSSAFRRRRCSGQIISRSVLQRTLTFLGKSVT